MLSNLKLAGDFSATGVKTSVPVGTTSTPGKVTLVSRVIPNGAAILLERFSAKVIDIGNADQIYFVIARNGQAIQAGLDRIPGVQFDYQPQIELGLYVYPGLLEIIAYNISGMATTIEPDAIVGAVAINAQAWWTGKLLSEKGGF